VRLVHVEEVGELVDPYVVGVVGHLEALEEGGDRQDDRAPGMSLARALVAAERVVAVEVVGVEEDLGEMVPLVLGPAHAERHRRGGDEETQLVRDLHPDAGDALLGEEDPDVVLEAGTPGGVQPLVVVVALQEEGPPFLREGRREDGPPPRGLPSEDAVNGHAHPDAGGEPGARARPAGRHRAERRARPRGGGAGHAAEAAVVGPLDPHRRGSPPG
jgi:hypothetical protein